MEPLIKWTGGKSGEFKHIEEMIPTFDTYVEPFFGGGGVFFAIMPKHAIVNDLSTDLMDFYRFVKGEKDREAFKEELYKYVERWGLLGEITNKISNDFLSLYHTYRSGEANELAIRTKIGKILETNNGRLHLLSNNNFCLNSEDFLNKIDDNLFSKMKRIKKIEDDGNKTFDNDEMKEHIETALRSGFYMYFREILNKSASGALKLPEAKKMANYYFIREFCYGSMFRFSSKGDFNIPYGGIAYNRKNFRKKVDAIFSNDVYRLFQNTTIENLDFAEFFKKHNFGENDFVFFDPPYDSDFSEYDLNPFTSEDQKRLAELIIGLKAKFILIIKNTPLIFKLYSGHDKIKIKKFDKSYLYNVRGRNVRETEHLIIYNF
ncbi:MAG: DNA adenine methylase [Candidatus Micrarchaeia archaeon]